MNRTEAATVLRKVLAYCPSQSVDELTPDAWAEALDDIRLTDALEAIRTLGRMPLEPGRSRYIDPGHVRSEVHRIRDQRWANTTIEPPPYVDADPDRYLDWLRDTRKAVMDGAPPPGPQRQLVTRPADYSRTVKTLEES